MGRGDAPQQLGKYQLHERLGRGGTSDVWKALDTQLQRYVAIKILSADLRSDPQFSTRFLREAQGIASLHHPNIVQIHDFHIAHYPEVEEPVAYMVMDYVAGQNLADYIAATSARKRFPSFEEIVYLFRVIGYAIDYAHQKGIIHRDIKPANIMLDQSAAAPYRMGEPVLTDFGLMKMISAPSVTIEGMWLGTPHYTSPEQARGSPVDKSSDIYSLGVILYEVCTGVRPFSGNNVLAILRQHINTTPPAPELINPTISPALAEVIMRSLAKDPEARFPTASSLATALTRVTRTTTFAAFDSTLSEGVMHEPTYTDRPVPSVGLKDTPSYIPTAPSPEPDELTNSQFVSPVDSGQRRVTRAGMVTPDNRGVKTAKFAKASISVQPPPGVMPSITPHTTKRRSKGVLATALIILVIALLGSSLGLGAFLWFPQLDTAPPPANPIVGHAFFVSSGQLNASGIESINDELLINLHNLQGLAPGKVYYAWLLRDKKEPLATPISLGMLPVKQGAVNELYAGVPQHTNLLAITSRFLITEENADSPPMSPAPDFSTVRYYGELAQEPDPNDANHLSPLDHLRSLLAQNPSVAGQDHYSNLDIWLLEETGRVAEWANSARDYWNDKNTQLMRDQFLRILEYLDGDSDVQTDLPAGIVPLKIAPVALLGLPVLNVQTPLLADYLHQVSGHLSAIAQAPGTTQEQRVLITHITAEINSVRNWLEQVRLDARQLINMSDTQLLSPQALTVMDDMVTQAFHAYTGQPVPSTGEVQSGVVQIHNDIERLAAFDIQASTFG